MDRVRYAGTGNQGYYAAPNEHITLARLKVAYEALTAEQKIDFLRHAIVHKPVDYRLRHILGEGSGERGFDLDFIDGILAEQKLVAVGRKTEVKHDFVVSETGNVAIETMYREQPSGLSATLSAWWFFWLGGAEYHDEVGVLIATRRLDRLILPFYETDGGDNKRARMRLVPCKELLRPDREIARAAQQLGLVWKV